MSNRARFLAQSVTLSGLNLEFFSKCIGSILAVDSEFSKQFETGKTVPWKKETYLSYSAITLSNRYFTDVSRRSYMQGVPFTIYEDPTGKMADLARGNALLHCEENVVNYYFHRKGRFVPFYSPEIKFSYLRYD
jgi:hypothetical protein